MGVEPLIPTRDDSTREREGREGGEGGREGEEESLEVQRRGKKEKESGRRNIATREDRRK